MRRGVKRLLTFWHPKDQKARAAIEMALRDIDGLYKETLDADQAESSVDSIENALQEKVTPLGGSPETPERQTSRQLGVQVETLNFLVWIIWFSCDNNSRIRSFNSTGFGLRFHTGLLAVFPMGNWSLHRWTGAPNLVPEQRTHCILD